MKKLMTVAAAAALLTASSLAAFAADVSGSIKSIDAAAGTVTLDNGHTYTLPANFDVASLKPGKKIMLTVGSDGKTITKVQMSSS